AFCKTGRAKARIRAYLRKEQRRRAVAMGKEILEKVLKRYGKSLQKLIKTHDLDKALQGSRYQKHEDLFAAVGYGKLKPIDVTKKVLPVEELEKGHEEDRPKSRLASLISAVA